MGREGKGKGGDKGRFETERNGREWKRFKGDGATEGDGERWEGNRRNGKTMRSDWRRWGDGASPLCPTRTRL